MRRAGAVSVSEAILLALLCIALVFSLLGPVGAQETTAEETTDITAGRQQIAQTDNGTLKFQEGTDATGRQAGANQPAGPLSGTEVDTRSTDSDVFVERILIPRPDCDLVGEETASFVLEDEDGTQADFIEDQNIEIEETRDGLLVRSKPGRTAQTGEPNDIEPLNERGGDDVLDTGGLFIVTSTGITCEDDNTPAPSPNPTPSPAPGATPGAEGCTTLATLSVSDQQTSDSFAEPEGAGQFRVAYETQNPDGSLQIFVNTATESNTTVLSKTVEGASSDVVTGEFSGTQAGYILSATPTDQQYRIVLQTVGGNDDCVEPVAVDDDGDDEEADVMADTIPDDDLPDTGGPSLPLVDAGLALVAVGASLIRFRR